MVKPATVVVWHRKGFKLYWRWKSRKHGRPKIDAEVRTLIRRMSKENPFWGAPRIQAEMQMVGFDVAKSTIAKYLVSRPSRPPSQTWRSFFANHLGCTAACDFFVVPTSTFRLLYAFVILSHCRREIVHINVTAASNGRVDGAAERRGFPRRRHRASRSDPRSRFDLRQDIRGPRHEHGHPAGDHVLPLATTHGDSCPFAATRESRLCAAGDLGRFGLPLDPGGTGVHAKQNCTESAQI